MAEGDGLDVLRQLAAKVTKPAPRDDWAEARDRVVLPTMEAACPILEGMGLHANVAVGTDGGALLAVTPFESHGDVETLDDQRKRKLRIRRSAGGNIEAHALKGPEHAPVVNPLWTGPAEDLTPDIVGARVAQVANAALGNDPKL